MKNVVVDTNIVISSVISANGNPDNNRQDLINSLTLMQAILLLYPFRTFMLIIQSERTETDVIKLIEFL